MPVSEGNTTLPTDAASVKSWGLHKVADGTLWLPQRGSVTTVNAMAVALSTEQEALLAAIGAAGYVEGATDSSIAGLAILFEDAADTLRVPSTTKPLPVDAGSPVLAAADDALACDTFRNAALSNTAVAVKAAAGCLYGYHIHNPSAATVYIQFYDVAQGSVTVGTTTPKMTFGIPAGASLDAPGVVPGISFGTAITVAATTTAAGSTAPASAAVFNAVFK